MHPPKVELKGKPIIKYVILSSYLILPSLLHYLFSYCHNLSLSNNLIYTIHYSYYSILISLPIENLFLVFYILIQYSYSNILSLFSITSYYISYSTLLLFILVTVWLLIILWLIDFLIESFIALTIIEQLSLIVGIKLLLLSELMLSFARSWCYINHRLVGSVLLLFYFPLLSSYSFSIPFTNLLILLFPSLPIQCSQLYIKIGFNNYSIEGIAQSLSAGFYSIILQCKEFSYPYFNLTDCLIGSTYYLTTGLHGFHVLSGPFLFYITLFYIVFSSISPFYFMEFPFPLFLSTHHWHFVDFIWLTVLLLFMV